MNMTIQELFTLGMKRDIPLLLPPGKSRLNLGAGNTPMPSAANLDLPEWDGERDRMPFDDETFDTVFAFHFLEHLTAKGVIHVLAEVQRVLKPGGTFNVVVPHRLGQMAYQDITHKTFWTEESWKVLMSNPYYNHAGDVPDKHRWKFFIRTNIIIGINERNLALMTQLAKECS